MDQVNETGSRITRFFREQLRPYDPESEPQPPRLEWFWLLVISIVIGYFTGALFIDIWIVLQANWIRRVNGKTLCLRLAAWCLALDCVCSVVGLLAKISFVQTHLVNSASTRNLSSFVELAIFSLYVVTNFTMRSALEDEPIGLSLSRAMTFFFAPYYFQFWLYDYTFTRRREPSLTGVPARDPAPSL